MCKSCKKNSKKRAKRVLQTVLKHHFGSFFYYRQGLFDQKTLKNTKKTQKNTLFTPSKILHFSLFLHITKYLHKITQQFWRLTYLHLLIDKALFLKTYKIFVKKHLKNAVFFFKKKMHFFVTFLHIFDIFDIF